MMFLRRSAPIVLVVLSLVVSMYRFAVNFSAGEWRNSSEEMVAKWEERVQVLKEALPKDVIRVGYVDDAALRGDESLLDVDEFQLMQYSVAPVAMDLGLDHEWIIGNFNDDENLEPWLVGQLGAYEIKGFGFGLYLIHDVEN